MRNIVAIMRREFLTRVRTRAFVIGTVIGPLLMAVLFALPILLERRQTAPKHIVVLDNGTGALGRAMAGRLAAEMRDTVTQSGPRYRIDHVPAGDRFDALEDSLVALTGIRDAGPLAVDGILVVDDSTAISGELDYVGVNVGSPGEMASLRRTLTPLVVQARLAESGVDPVLVMRAMRPVELQTFKVAEGRITGETGEASFLLAYAMSMLLYFALLVYGMQVMSSVVEEKSSRIMEVLVSSVSPFQMLLGKVLGTGSVALLQLGIWGSTAMVLTTFKVQLAGLFGASPASVASFAIPTVGPDMLAVFLLFFTLGFIFYSALYAAVGSMCSSVQDTQQAQMPVTLCMLAGLICMFALLSEPAGPLARILSLVPFVAPFVTPVRYSFSPLPWAELLASAVVMIVGVLAVTWVAARIYRVGILSYGKKASLRDVVRWVRAD
jgi:ABC-2 type transport system permease protein